jgi:hypothetical protein
MNCRVLNWMLTDVSEVRAASIIRACKQCVRQQNDAAAVSSVLDVHHAHGSCSTGKIVSAVLY